MKKYRYIIVDVLLLVLTSVLVASLDAVYYHSNETGSTLHSDSVMQERNLGFWESVKGENKPVQLKSGNEVDRYKSNLILSKARKSFEAGNLYQALEACNKSIQIDTTNAACYFLRAEVNRLLNKDLDAISDYTKTLQLNANYYQAYLNRGILCLKTKKTAAAYFDFTKAIMIKPLKTLSFLISHAFRAVF